jgi:hypothetical protein
MKNYFKILFERCGTLMLLTPAILLGWAYLVFVAKLVVDLTKWIWGLW